MFDCVRKISFDVSKFFVFYQRLQAVKYGTKIPILFDTCVIINNPFWFTTVNETIGGFENGVRFETYVHI